MSGRDRPAKPRPAPRVSAPPSPPSPATPRPGPPTPRRAGPSGTGPRPRRLWAAPLAAAPPFFLRRRPPRRRLPFGKFLSSSRASALGLRAIRMRAPSSTCWASGVCASAAASSAALSRRSCLRAAWTSRRALRACAAPAEFTSRPSSRLVSGQRCTAYSSCTSREYSARCQSQRAAWSRRPICRSVSAWSSTLTPSRRSSRDQPPTISTASSKASGSRRPPTSDSARSRSCVLRLRRRQVMRNCRRSSPVLSKWSIALARRQLFDATRAPASIAQACCCPQVRCSTAMRHSSRSKTCARRSSSAVTGTTRRSTRSRRPRPRRTGPTTIAPPR